MLTLLPFDVLFIVYRQLCLFDKTQLTNTSKALRQHFIHNRYKNLIINRHHCVPNKLDWKYYEIRVRKSIGDETLSISSDDYPNFDRNPSHTLKKINVTIHWSADKVESIVELLKLLKAWNVKLDVRLIQHNSHPNFHDTVGLDKAFQSLSCVRLSTTMYGLLTKAYWFDGKVSKLRFRVPGEDSVSVDDEDLKFPDEVHEVEFTSDDVYRFLDIRVLRRILEANFLSSIRKLSIEGIMATQPAPRPPDYFEDISLPPSVTDLNYYLFNNSSVDICSGHVRHLSVKPHLDAESFNDYAVVMAYFDRNVYLPNGSPYPCYHVDLTVLQLWNAVSSTIVLDNRQCCGLTCGLKQGRPKYRKSDTFLWGVGKYGRCNIKSLDITIMQNLGPPLPAPNPALSVKRLRIHGIYLLPNCPGSYPYPSVALNKEKIQDSFERDIHLVRPSLDAECTISEAAVYNDGTYVIVVYPNTCDEVIIEEVSTPYVTKIAHDKNDTDPLCIDERFRTMWDAPVEMRTTSPDFP